MILSRLNKRCLFQIASIRGGNKGGASAATATATATATRVQNINFSSTPTSSPTSFTHDRIETDERYASTTKVPESLQESGASVKGEYSIQGEFRDGRAAYLDMSSTTPLDPRVFDKMAPYMVCVCFLMLNVFI